jgi:hypothetical protein
MSTAQSTGSADASIQAGQGGVIQDVRGCVSDLFHCQSNPTGIFVYALLARTVGGLAYAWDQRERPFQHPDDLSNRDIAWFPAKGVTAASALLALQETMAGKVQQNRLEEFPWKSLPLSEFRGLNRSSAGFVGERQHRAQTVFQLLGQHTEKSSATMG